MPLPVVNGQWVKGVGGAAVWAPLAAYGTTLPASPLNGDEAVLVDSVTNPSYQWRLLQRRLDERIQVGVRRRCSGFERR